jgi:hypothetical protein
VGNFGADGTIYGFVRDRHGTYTTIRPPRAAATLVTGINERGDVVGTYSTVGSEDLLVGAPRSFVFRNGVYRDITVPDAMGTGVNGIDNRGRVAGTYADASGTLHGFVSTRNGDIETVDHPTPPASARPSTPSRPRRPDRRVPEHRRRRRPTNVAAVTRPEGISPVG